MGRADKYFNLGCYRPWPSHAAINAGGDAACMSPKRLEKALKASAKRKGFREGSERYKRYVYGTMAKIKQEHKNGKR